jgi:hypothetical protein
VRSEAKCVDGPRDAREIFWRGVGWVVCGHVYGL